MRNTKIMEMLNKGQIEDLKAALEDEIYEESLKAKPNAKKRYAAMKKYFGYAGSVREALQKPCVVEFEGQQYTSFCNSYSLALTTEDTGELELFEDASRYPDVSRLIRFDGDEKKVDFTKVIAEAKSKGYKLKKSEFYSNKYLMRYSGSYFRMMLLESTYGIIDDGEEATVYHSEHSNRPLVIKNDIGICVVMPVRYEGDPEENGDIVIEVDA
jgi:hypothetical protein